MLLIEQKVANSVHFGLKHLYLKVISCELVLHQLILGHNVLLD